MEEEELLWSSSSSLFLSSARVSSKNFLYFDFDFATANLELVNDLWMINLDVEGSILSDNYRFLLNHSKTFGLVAFAGLNSCHHFVLNFLARASWKFGIVIIAYSQQEIHDRDNWRKKLRRENFLSLSRRRIFC